MPIIHSLRDQTPPLCGPWSMCPSSPPLLSIHNLQMISCLKPPTRKTSAPLQFFQSPIPQLYPQPWCATQAPHPSDPPPLPIRWHLLLTPALRLGGAALLLLAPPLLLLHPLRLARCDRSGRGRCQSVNVGQVVLNGDSNRAHKITSKQTGDMQSGPRKVFSTDQTCDEV